MGKGAVLLARHIGELVHKEVAKHKRGCERSDEDREAPIRDRLQTRIVAPVRSARNLAKVVVVVIRHRAATQRDRSPAEKRKEKPDLAPGSSLEGETKPPLVTVKSQVRSIRALVGVRIHTL